MTEAEFMEWARLHLGQGYGFEKEDGSFTDRVTRWAFKAFKAGAKRERKACLEAVLEVGRTTGDTPDMAEYCADAIRARTCLALLETK